MNHPIDPNALAEIIEQMVTRATEKIYNRTYKRGEVSAINGQFADVYVEGNPVATTNLPALYSYTPVVGHKVLIVSIGTSGANLVIMGRLPTA